MKKSRMPIGEAIVIFVIQFLLITLAVVLASIGLEPRPNLTDMLKMVSLIMCGSAALCITIGLLVFHIDRLAEKKVKHKKKK